MRRKKHLDNRLNSVNKYLILIDKMDKNPFSELESKQYLDTLAVFGNSNPVVLDIGCGKGNFAIEYALTHKDENVLAVEMISNVIVDACDKAIALQIPNIKFINSGAEYLNRYIANNTVSKIYLNFPCPYFKNSYVNHRLTNPKFLGMFEQMLISQGRFLHKTDNLEFFEYSVKNLKAYGFILDIVCRDLSNSEIENIVTEYENKFIGLGRPIYYLNAISKIK